MHCFGAATKYGMGGAYGEQNGLFGWESYIMIPLSLLTALADGRIYATEVKKQMKQS